MTNRGVKGIIETEPGKDRAEETFNKRDPHGQALRIPGLYHLNSDHSCKPERCENMTFDEFLKLPFTEAQRAITSFSMEKRIKMLDELTTRRTYYYNQAAKFGEGIPKDEQLSPEAFRSLLGKIKHIEIVQNWLYGIA